MPDENNRRKWSKFHLSSAVSVETGPCQHIGDEWSCPNRGYDQTFDLCPDHFVTDEIEPAEAALRELNARWSDACEVQSQAKEIWRCTCGFSGTYEERDKHFVANDGDTAHTPPIKNAPVRVMGGKRLTKPSITTLKEEDLG